MLTVDSNLGKQQNLADLAIPVVVMRCRANSIHALRVHVPGMMSLLNQSLQRRVYVLEAPQDDRTKGGAAESAAERSDVP